MKLDWPGWQRVVSAAVALGLVFAFSTPVSASPAIPERSFETVSGWTYSEDDADYTDGAQSTTWVTNGTYSYLLSASSAVSISNNTYAQVSQSVDLTNIDTLYFDARLYADTTGKFEARVLVGATTVWGPYNVFTQTEYLHQSVDLSGYTGSQSLIFQVITKATANKIAMEVYYDNITVWESYDDAVQTNVWGTVTNRYDTGSETVYVYGEAFANSQLYHVGFYDPSVAPNIVAITDPTSTSTGALSTQYLLSTDQSATAGTWHAVVYMDPDTPPDTYNASDTKIVEDDDFEVAAGAIPEFPTVMAAIIVAGLCFGAYYWMRKRQLAYVKV